MNEALTSYLENMRQEKILIVGTGISNNAVIAFFNTNQIPFTHLPNCEEHTFDQTLITDLTIVIKAPSIPHHFKLIAECALRNIVIINEIEIGYQLLKLQDRDTKLIAITGTNGKSTTITLIDEILRSSKLQSTVAGNIGKVFLDVVLDKNTYDFICVELSSYQLKSLLYFQPDYAAILNIENDHLEYHETFEDYQAAKFNIMDNMLATD